MVDDANLTPGNADRDEWVVLMLLRKVECGRLVGIHNAPHVGII